MEDRTECKTHTHTNTLTHTFRCREEIWKKKNQTVHFVAIFFFRRKFINNPTAYTYVSNPMNRMFPSMQKQLCWKIIHLLTIIRVTDKLKSILILFNCLVYRRTTTTTKKQKRISPKLPVNDEQFIHWCI